MSETNETADRSWVARLLSPWVTIPFALFLVAVSSPVVYRASRLNGIPPIEVFDVEAFLDFEVDPTAGCWPKYARAQGLLVSDRVYVARIGYDEFANGYDGWENAHPVFREYMEANRPALKAWRDATGEDFTPRVHPRIRPFFDRTPSVPDFREFARLAVLFAERDRRNGDVGEALSWYEAVLRASVHVRQMGCVMEKQLGVAVFAIAVDDLAKWAGDGRVDAAQLRRARAVLAEIEVATPPLEEAIKVDYVLVWNSLHAAHPAERARFLREFEGSAPGDWLRNEPTVGMRLIDHEAAHLLETSQLRWTDFKSRTGTFGYLAHSHGHEVMSGGELTLRVNSSSVAQEFGFAFYHRILQSHCRGEARFRALDLVLAAELHRRVTGAYPTTAADIVPDVLAAVPEDPFGPTGTPLRYRVRDGRPNTWSIGPDGIDDDGRFDGDANDDIGVPGNDSPTATP